MEILIFKKKSFPRCKIQSEIPRYVLLISSVNQTRDLTLSSFLSFLSFLLDVSADHSSQCTIQIFAGNTKQISGTSRKKLGNANDYLYIYIYPTPPQEQGVTLGQFLSGI